MEAEAPPTAPTYPLVGRGAAWEILTSAYRTTSSNGSFILVQGEAGIGKTRLAQEFIRYVEAQGGKGIALRAYEGSIRQVVVRGNGHEKPTFLITNDFRLPVELLVGHYARRWRVENGIAEAVKFFHLNALSSPILVKVHFDVALTMMADTLYTMLARKLRGSSMQLAAGGCCHAGRPRRPCTRQLSMRTAMAVR